MLISAPSTGDVLVYSGSVWTNQTLSSLNAGTPDSQEVTSNTLTITATRMEMNNESATDLNTISGSPADGDIIILEIGDQTITVKHGVDNIYLDGATDFAMDSIRDKLMLMYDDGLGEWHEIGRGDNS